MRREPRFCEAAVFAHRFAPAVGYYGRAALPFAWWKKGEAMRWESRFFEAAAFAHRFAPAVEHYGRGKARRKGEAHALLRLPAARFALCVDKKGEAVRREPRFCEAAVFAHRFAPTVGYYGRAALPFALVEEGRSDAPGTARLRGGGIRAPLRPYGGVLWSGRFALCVDKEGEAMRREPRFCEAAAFAHRFAPTVGYYGRAALPFA